MHTIGTVAPPGAEKLFKYVIETLNGVAMRERQHQRQQAAVKDTKSCHTVSEDGGLVDVTIFYPLDVYITISNLAKFYTNQGRYAEALKLYRDCYPTTKC